MGTRFESDIASGEGDQGEVDIRHRSEGIDFGMCLAESAMKSLTDDSAIRSHDQRPHHRIGRDMTGTRHSQANGSTHIHFICSHK